MVKYKKADINVPVRVRGRCPFYEDTHRLQSIKEELLFLSTVTTETPVTQPEQWLQQGILGAKAHVCKRAISLQTDEKQVYIKEKQLMYKYVKILHNLDFPVPCL